MTKEHVDLIIGVVSVIGAIITAALGYTMKNKNSVKNNKSQNISNSSNVNIEENNYGINNKIDK